MVRYAIVIEKGPTSYGAYVPDLPGCVAVGKTAAEVRKLIAEAVPLHWRGCVKTACRSPTPKPNASTLTFDFASRRTGRCSSVAPRGRGSVQWEGSLSIGAADADTKRPR